MNSGSWSSYRAAMPPECFGEPDDEPAPRRSTNSRCDRCGRFFSRKPGSGARFDFTPDSIFGPERCEWLCARCAAKNPVPPTEAEMREHKRKTLEDYGKAMAEAHAAELAAMAGRCEWCGRELPVGRAATTCEACERVITFDGGPYSGDEIPW